MDSEFVNKKSKFTYCKSTLPLHEICFDNCDYVYGCVQTMNTVCPSIGEIIAAHNFGKESKRH